MKTKQTSKWFPLETAKNIINPNWTNEEFYTIILRMGLIPDETVYLDLFFENEFVKNSLGKFGNQLITDLLINEVGIKLITDFVISDIESVINKNRDMFSGFGIDISFIRR